MITGAADIISVPSPIAMQWRETGHKDKLSLEFGLS